MAQTFVYPPTFSTSVNPSVGPNGSPIPTSSTLIAGKGPTGLETPVSVDSSGNVNVNLVSTSPTPLPVTDAAAEASLASIDGKTVYVDTGNVTVVASALPTGAATAANQATEIASLASIDSKLTSPITVTGPLTDTQLRATAVPVSVASLPLPAGAATSANQATEIASLASIDGKTVHVDTDNVTVVTSALPTGAATSALQTTGNTSLSSIDSKTAALGQAVMASSSPVVIASNQSAIPVTVASVPLPTGAATESTLAAFSDKSAGAFVHEAFDYADITYVGSTTDINTVVYKTGGSGGTTVATLTLGYDGSNRLSTVTKT